MDREIKFRAWDKDNKKMLQVKSIHFSDSGDCIVINPLEFISLEFLELMQYTGLKDKNDVEIYEGDIVKSRNGTCGRINIHIIEWNNFYTGFNPLRQDESNFNRESSEVIGNIYENQELLKEETTCQH